MGDVDYGYGDSGDYGYGDSAPDYGYGDDNQDYGYGDGGGGEDYGYGDAAPDQDYGYGDGAPDQDYGYGDASPDQDYGYGDEAPAPLPTKAPEKRPKRRCSVTRFSIEAEANDKPLDYNWTPEQAQQPAPEPEPEAAPAADEKSSAQTESTVDTNEGGSMIDKIPVDKLNMPKKGMMSRIRKRLSIM